MLKPNFFRDNGLFTSRPLPDPCTLCWCDTTTKNHESFFAGVWLDGFITDHFVVSGHHQPHKFLFKCFILINSWTVSDRSKVLSMNDDNNALFCTGLAFHRLDQTYNLPIYDNVNGNITSHSHVFWKAKKETCDGDKYCENLRKDEAFFIQLEIYAKYKIIKGNHFFRLYGCANQQKVYVAKTQTQHLQKYQVMMSFRSNMFLSI